MMEDFLPLCFSNLHTNVLPFTVKITLKIKYYSHFIIYSERHLEKTKRAGEQKGLMVNSVSQQRDAQLSGSLR